MTNDTRQGTRSRVALVLPDLSGGGAGRTVLTLATGLVDQGYKVDIVLFRHRVRYPTDVPAKARLHVAEANVPGSSKGPDDRTRRFDWVRSARALNWDPPCLPDPGLVRQTRAVASYMEREKPDLVLPNLPRADVATLLAGGLLDSHPPIMPIIHNMPVIHGFRGLRYRRRYRHLATGAIHFVGVSEGVSESFAATIRIPRDRITTIYNPVVTPTLHVKMVQPPGHPWFLDGGPPVILSAGRFVRAKDHATLIRAFHRLASRRACRLIVVGDGRQRRRIQRLVKRLGLSDRVSLPGWAENPLPLMANASCFVLSSRHEGLGLALIESLACGCPCVSTDCPAGPAEILQNGRLGPLVPVGDDAALADAMERVLDQPPDKRALRERAAYFSADRAVAAYDRLISAVVGRRPT